MADGTDFGSLDRIHGLEAKDQPRLFAVRVDMLAAWTMTCLAGMAVTKIPMNAVPVSFVEIFVAAQALLVVVDILGALGDGKFGSQNRERRFAETKIRLWPAWAQFGLGAPSFMKHEAACGDAEAKNSQQDASKRRGGVASIASSPPAAGDTGGVLSCD